MITIKKCNVCVYLENYDDDFVRKVNNSLFCNYKYSETLKILKSASVENNLPFPSKYSIANHGNNCLKDFKPITLKKVTVKTNGVVTDEIPVVFSYTDYSKNSREDIPSILRNEMINLACKLIDIANYRLNNFTGIDKTENVKDTVSSLKIIIDLFNTGIDKDSTNTNQELAINQLRNTKEFVEFEMNKLKK